MEDFSLVVIPGSVRSGSLNLRLARFAADRARQTDIRAHELDLRQLELPIYDGDLEARSGIPPGALRLQLAIVDADALLLVTPEYNGFPTPLVINAFDWLSRIKASGSRPAGLAVTANKPAGLLSASPGPGGALRSMNFLRQYLQMAFAMLVVPQQFALGRADEAFDEQGALKDAKARHSVDAVVAALGKVGRALRAAA